MRIVFKVGTSTLCHSGRGLNYRNIELLARALADVKNAGHEVTLVSSGAIGTGLAKLNLPERPRELRLKQAIAAVGQLELMHIYDKYFGEYGATVAQILLTFSDTGSERRRANLIGTFDALFSLGVIPVVNENDSVAFEEIESHSVFGDNDTLSATVAVMVRAEKLVILTDTDGLYDSDPHANPDARLITVVDAITSEIEALAGGAGSNLGTGGMATKIQAAKIATAAGCEVVIMNGSAPDNIYRAVNGLPVGTLFRAKR
ncbi:MAG: glutamate 5-kinase [Oscillospiraceae bacterium]|jgi:glutamate 5-kinase|nr:glutamate 5-kinase [Oscillospiraceae bacterium]